MTRESRAELMETIKRELPCSTYLGAGKAHENETMYKCPFCGSGTKTHKTGALAIPTEANAENKGIDPNRYICYSCGATGDVLDLIQHEYGTDLNGAIQIGASDLGINIDAWDAQRSRKSDFNAKSDKKYPKAEKTPQIESESHTEVSADYTEYYKACWERLPQSKEAVTYLQERGISAATAEALFVGYDPEADPAKAPGAMGDEPRPHPGKRIIIPTSARQYIGRSVNPSDKLRYINSAGGSPGIFNAKALQQDHEFIFVVEGAFDAMSFTEAGAAAVAINSTSNTKKIIDYLRENPTKAALIICFDVDEAQNTRKTVQGKAQELHERLKETGVKSAVFDISPYLEKWDKDINDILVRNPETLKRLIKDAEAVEMEEVTAPIEPEKAKTQQETEPAKEDYLEAFAKKIQTEAYKPFKTGLAFFDDLLGGGVLQQSLIVLMAAPGMGKTALAQQLAEAMAANQKPVIYLNFEMSREQMLARSLSCRLARKGHSETARQILQGYAWNDTERAQILAELEEYRKTQYPFIQYNPDGTSAYLDVMLKELNKHGAEAKKAGKDAPAVFVDYMHLIAAPEDGGKIEAQELIKRALVGLKEYAMKYDTFVLAIAAMNRNTNSSGRITLESGRDSSNIEYTGDYILALNYWDVENGTVTPSNQEGYEAIQLEVPRRMALKVLKARFDQSVKKKQINFVAKHSTFYGAGEFMPDLDRTAPFEGDDEEDDEDLIIV